MLKQLLNYIKTEIGIGPFLFALVMVAKVLGFSVGPLGSFGIPAMVIAIIYLLYSKSKVDTSFAILLFYIPISIALASPNPVFRSWERYVYFVMLIIAVSPILKGEKAAKFRNSVFKGTSLFCVVIAVVCFFCYFLGINYMRRGWDGSLIEDYLVNTAGTFSGITSHSMLLGPIAGISVLVCCYWAMVTKRWYYWILAILSMGSVLFAASRSSLISTLIGVVALFFFFQPKMGKAIKRLFIVILLGTISYPMWQSALDGLNEKNKGDIEEGINLDSRKEKWNIRIAEWKDSPIWGIGFVAVSDRDDYGASSGVIEPGSSWLAVLSMTGLIGFIIFCSIFYRSLKNTLPRRTPESALLGGCLILVGVHMIGEGHIFSAGSFLCFLVWLIIGCSTDYSPELNTSIEKK